MSSKKFWGGKDCLPSLWDYLSEDHSLRLLRSTNLDEAGIGPHKGSGAFNIAGVFMGGFGCSLYVWGQVEFSTIGPE